MTALLEVRGLSVSYGGLRALKDVSFSVAPGECFVLLGANGAGKTSLLRCIGGLVRPVAGAISGNGLSLLGLRPSAIAHRGIAHVPEGRRVFPHLSVFENLSVSWLRRPGGPTLPDAVERIYGMFPRLAERRHQLAGTLSGGEQQALAIGRGLMNSPSLLMLDEPSLGLAPVITRQVFSQLNSIRESGIALLLVEQNASSLDLATRGLVLANGSVALAGSRDNLRDSAFVRRAYLGL
ncbi:MAG: ABC transporter ATP-binding protein [Rhodospirillales bacterium]|nr:ABC transporter ATP-binding protein [Rhodospirillales bacterium]